MVASQWYAKAFVAAAATSENHEPMVDRLIVLIKRNGDWSRRAKIVAACGATVRASTGKHLLEVASAHRLGSEELKMLEKEFSKERYDYKMTVDRGLIGGARCTIDESFEYDATLACMMRKMFTK